MRIYNTTNHKNAALFRLVNPKLFPRAPKQGGMGWLQKASAEPERTSLLPWSASASNRVSSLPYPRHREISANMMTTAQRVPFGDISNKENVVGAVAGKKGTAATTSILPPAKSLSQEAKETENQLFEQVSCCLHSHKNVGDHCTRHFALLSSPSDGGMRRRGGRDTASEGDGKGRASLAGEPATLRHVPNRVP